MSAVKVGQVWQDKDKRRDTVIEIIKVPTDLRGDAEVIGLVVGTEEERTSSVDRLVKRWELMSEKDTELEAVLSKDIAQMEQKHATREQWLSAAVVALREGIFAPDHTVPEVRVSVGWPGGRGPKQNRIGECWQPDSSADGIGQIFISPVLSDPVEVLATLTHELVHAINHKDGDNGHRAPFKRIAESVGLEGKMASTHAGEALAEKLEAIGNMLGKYPHAAISLESKPKVQKTYMLKFVSPEEPDFFVRMTKGKYEEYGAPRDPWGNEMEQEQ